MSQAENKNKEKTDWSVHVICLWAQQLNIHLNNQMMTCLAVQTLTNQTQSEGTLGEWTQGGRTDQTKPQKTKSKQKQKTKGKKIYPHVPFTSVFFQCYRKVQSSILCTEKWTELQSLQAAAVTTYKDLKIKAYSEKEEQETWGRTNTWRPQTIWLLLPLSTTQVTVVSSRSSRQLLTFFNLFHP